MKNLWLPVVKAKDKTRCSVKCKMLLHHSRMHADCIAYGLEELRFNKGFLRTEYCKNNAREIE